MERDLLEPLTKRELISLIDLEVDRVEALRTQLAERDEALAAFRAFVRAWDETVEAGFSHDSDTRFHEARAAVERWMGEDK